MKASYAEHESICKSTLGSMLTVLSERIPSEQNQGEILNSCPRQGVENTMNCTENATSAIVKSSVMSNNSAMQLTHGNMNEISENVRSYKPDKIRGSTIKRRVSLGNESIISTVKKTLVRDVGMGWKFGQAFKSADMDVNFLSIMPSVSIETNAATAVGSMKANVQIMNNAASSKSPNVSIARIGISTQYYPHRYQFQP